jgi:FAS-associated factor 2
VRGSRKRPRDGCPALSRYVSWIIVQVYSPAALHAVLLTDTRIVDEVQLRERANVPPARQDIREERTHEPLISPVPFPFLLVGLPFQILSRVLGLAAAAMNAASRQILPRPIYRALGRFFRRLAPVPRNEDPVGAAADFISGFSARYGERTPKWELTGWETAAQKSQNEGMFLFVYLHSERHQDSESFCKETLCCPSFVDYLNATFVSWGGDIRCPEAFRLSTKLRVTRYPYCALLAFSGTQTRLISCSEGNIRPEALAERLQQSLTEHGGILWEERLLREQREHDRRLREEQDADFQRSLEADRLKDLERRQREEEQERLEMLERQREQQAMDELERLRARRTERKLTMDEEAVETGERMTGVVRIRFPTGETQQRRFYMDSEFARVVEWVESLDCNPYLHFTLSTTYPRRMLEVDHHTRTLAELDFEKQTALAIAEA